MLVALHQVIRKMMKRRLPGQLQRAMWQQVLIIHCALKQMMQVFSRNHMKSRRLFLKLLNRQKRQVTTLIKWLLLVAQLGIL